MKLYLKRIFITNTFNITINSVFKISKKSSFEYNISHGLRKILYLLV